SHQTRVDILRAEADSIRISLQGEVERCQAERDSLRRQLAVSQADSSRLRAVAGQAQAQIDSILMRLPGASQESSLWNALTYPYWAGTMLWRVGPQKRTPCSKPSVWSISV